MITSNENTMQDLLTYELANNWICQWISIEWLQNIIAKRLANKVERKYKRYVEFIQKCETSNLFL